jgi:hypothetical protein
MMGARSAAARLARRLRASRLARLKKPFGFDTRVLPSGCTGKINSRAWGRQRWDHMAGEKRRASAEQR